MYTAAVTGTAVVKDSAGVDVTTQFIVNKVDGKLTINMPKGTTATVTANNRTYDGTAQPLVNVDNSTLVGGEMQYRLGEGEYSTAIPEATETGYYTVYYNLVPDEFHSAVDEQSVTVKIEANFTTLNDAIASATDYYNTIKDTYTDIAAALQSAIDAAQLIADNADASQAVVDAAVVAMNDAKSSAENKSAFEVSKAAGVLTALGKGLAGDSDEVNAIIDAAKAAIEALVYDETKTLAENEAQIEAILTQFDADLTAQRNAEKAAFDAAKADGENGANSRTRAGDVKDAATLIEAAKNAIDALEYDETLKPDANNARVDQILTQLDTDLAAARVNAFEAYKAEQKAALGASKGDIKNDFAPKLLEKAYADIDALSYDESMSFDENCARVNQIVKQASADIERSIGACPLCGEHHDGHNAIKAIHYVIYWLTWMFRDWLPGFIK